jgi:hypothetical protein
VTTRSGKYFERPITSDRAELVARAVATDGLTVVELLARGQVTLAAVAVAYYGGDLARAKAAIYDPKTT